VNHSRSADSRAQKVRRRWADVVVIIAAVYVFFAAIWSPPELISRGDAGAVADTTWLYIAYAAGGALAFAGLFVAQRWIGLGRALIGVAGIVVLSAFLALREITLLAVLSIGVSGVALIAAAPFAGPMPSPEEEGRERSSPGA
jgi:peptidoglycan/LPS O-acetylase OafA/YrhL